MLWSNCYYCIWLWRERPKRLSFSRAHISDFYASFSCVCFRMLSLIYLICLYLLLQGLFSRITFREPVFLGGTGNITGLAKRLPVADGMTGCIRKFVANEHEYVFAAAPTGDITQGFDIRKYICWIYIYRVEIEKIFFLQKKVGNESIITDYHQIAQCYRCEFSLIRGCYAEHLHLLLPTQFQYCLKHHTYTYSLMLTWCARHKIFICCLKTLCTRVRCKSPRKYRLIKFIVRKYFIDKS